MVAESQKCELCGDEIKPPPEFPTCRPIRLAGMCEKCSQSLGGGVYSAKAVREERRLMDRRAKN